MFVRLNRWLRARQLGGDGGMAMVMVIGVSSVLAILVVSAIAIAVGQVKSARQTGDWSAALAAAYAGVEEYQSRLAANPAYMQYGNANAKFSAGSTFIPEPGSARNAAFRTDAASPWPQVPDGSGGSSPASFRYEVNNALYVSDGVVKLRSTGRVGTVTRTVVADLRQTGFLDFLYFTDYEIQDPDFSGKGDACVKYGYDGRAADCAHIAFGSSDVLNGPVHSNDVIRTCNAIFNGKVTTTAPMQSAGKRFLQVNSLGSSSGCGASQWNGNGDLRSPAYSDALPMPATNLELKKEVRTDLRDVTTPGCLYTGPTSMVFTADGMVTIKSPWTKRTQVTGDNHSGGSAAGTPGTRNDGLCGQPGNGRNGLASPTGATIRVPQDRVLYVQSVPGGSRNVNGSSAAAPEYTSCVGEDGKTAGNGIGFPVNTEFIAAGTTPYDCKSGDVFVKGVVNSKTTITAERYVYVTGDITYSDTQANVLGLIGQDAVLVWNPVRHTSGDLERNPTFREINASNREINAAMLSLGHTFQVQNYNRGSGQGTLTVNGAISQKFRGIVRSGSSGYAKNYNYDERFRYLAPPKFLQPVTTVYGVSRWIEVGAAYNARGVPL